MSSNMGLMRLATSMKLVLAAQLLVGMEFCHRDKTGTTPPNLALPIEKTLGNQGVFGVGSFSTERMRFELMIRFKPYTAFPVRRLRPLGHLSRLGEC